MVISDIMDSAKNKTLVHHKIWHLLRKHNLINAVKIFARLCDEGTVYLSAPGGLIFMVKHVLTVKDGTLGSTGFKIARPKNAHRRNNATQKENRHH